MTVTTETYTVQKAALEAVLDSEHDQATELLQDLDNLQLQDLAYACTLLANLCRETAIQNALTAGQLTLGFNDEDPTHGH